MMNGPQVELAAAVAVFCVLPTCAYARHAVCCGCGKAGSGLFSEHNVGHQVSDCDVDEDDDVRPGCPINLRVVRLLSMTTWSTQYDVALRLRLMSIKKQEVSPNYYDRYYALWSPRDKVQRSINMVLSSFTKVSSVHPGQAFRKLLQFCQYKVNILCSITCHCLWFGWNQVSCQFHRLYIHHSHTEQWSCQLQFIFQAQFQLSSLMQFQNVVVHSVHTHTHTVMPNRPSKYNSDYSNNNYSPTSSEQYFG